MTESSFELDDAPPPDRAESPTQPNFGNDVNVVEVRNRAASKPFFASDHYLLGDSANHAGDFNNEHPVEIAVRRIPRQQQYWAMADRLR